MSLEDIQSLYVNSQLPLEQVEEKLQEEIEDFLDENTRAEAREEIEDIDDREFRELALDILDQNS